MNQEHTHMDENAWTHFLNNSKSVITVNVDDTFKIINHNSYFAELLGMQSTILGKSLFHFLMPESASTFQDANGKAPKLVRIVFKDKNNIPLPLQCTCTRGKNETIIIGEKPLLTNDEIMLKMTTLNSDLVNLTRELQKKNRELEYANSTIKTLRGILPICSFCKGIRDDEGYWKKIEEYMSEETEAQFSHSICPQCMEKNYPELFEED